MNEDLITVVGAKGGQMGVEWTMILGVVSTEEEGNRLIEQFKDWREAYLAIGDQMLLESIVDHLKPYEGFLKECTEFRLGTLPILSNVPVVTGGLKVHDTYTHVKRTWETAVHRIERAVEFPKVAGGSPIVVIENKTRKL